MKLTISKSKSAEQLYITKSFRDESGKSTSKIITKLGTMEKLLPEHDNDREKVILWGKEIAKKMTIDEKNNNLNVSVNFSESLRNEKGEPIRFNIGYLFLQKIFYQLKLNKVCDEIKKTKKITFDLNDILSKLVYARIIDPSSKLSTYEFSKSFLEFPKFDSHHIYRALDVLAENSDEIQSHIYDSSHNLIKRNDRVLYYDCTNFFFEIEKEDGIKKYGKSKEHRPNPIVQMVLLLDGSGFPLAFTIFPGNSNEQKTLKPLEKKIISDFKLSKFIICTDAGLSSFENRKFNMLGERSFIVTQSLKKINKNIKNWALSNEGWKLGSDKRTYNIDEIDDDDYMDSIFFKERWINKNGMEQRIIVSYSPKYKLYQREIRYGQINRALKIIENGNRKSSNTNSPNRIIKDEYITSSGEIANIKKSEIDIDRISDEEKYDGFYAVCTNLEDPIENILKINKQRWQIESSFRTVKSEFKARPVYLRRENRIKAHFLTCFLSLMIIKILEYKLENKFSIHELIDQLKEMELHKIRNIGYLSSYTRSDITDELHKFAGFNTDYEFISDENIKKIIKNSKI
ncbi:IS1634 family transposase [Peptostreptococcus canis]|uniref:IS1634 family transposase n=1 Tax=Peptostreptococcus canis TaxID=1159213 RepID=A0ABR6TLI9_9FIRM|nr:IS1634 family transposase [Peptostreptococcus canis]MBC2576275.1 IS1634 family transposase [Peptostreptococcus canis]MBP1998188.1 transposase [Peptostreptococcus canis]